MLPQNNSGKANVSKNSPRKGYVVTFGAFAVMFITFGVAYSFAPFFYSLQSEFSATRGDVSMAFSIAVPLYFALGGVSGPLADRYGPRTIGILGMVVGGLGLVMAARASALWEIYLGYGVGIGIAVGFSYVPAIGAVQGWFSSQRGTASGIAVSGIGLGTLCMPMAAAQLIDLVGWRAAWTVLGLLIIGVGGLAMAFVKKAPLPAPLSDGNVATKNSPMPIGEAGLWEAVKSRKFAVLYVSLIAISVGAFIPFVHLVPYAEDLGASHETAVWIFSALGLGSTFGRFLVGGIADRLGRRKTLVALFATLGVMLVWWIVSSVAWQLFLFALVFSGAYGGFVALFPALTADYFGTRNSIGIIGILYTAASIGTLAGPKLAGDAFDAFGSYSLMIAISAALSFVAAGLVAFMPEPCLDPRLSDAPTPHCATSRP